jgi:histidine ammonia-lyase
MPGGDALRRASLEPVVLAEKEGLALINGTHLMASCGGLALLEARRVLEAAIVASALSLEAFMGSTAPFDDRIHALRPQPGQRRVAARLRELLAASPIVASHADCGRVQDPYTLRCIPQVLGAVSDALDYVERTLALELTAVTDNPLVFPDEGDVVSGGNFHGQPLSLVLDHLALALCVLASFSERRTYALLSPSYAGLPPFLTPHPGLNSGLMIVQYAQASLVSECMVLSHPAGAGSIPTSAGQEDFNSMGALAALKSRTVVELASHVVASELACACQGLEFHRPLHTTGPLEEALGEVRRRIPRVEHDRSLSDELTVLARDIRLGELALP